MVKMGYVMGTGLGRKGDGRLEPVEALVFPAGKSLGVYDLWFAALCYHKVKYCNMIIYNLSGVYSFGLNLLTIRHWVVLVNFQVLPLCYRSLHDAEGKGRWCCKLVQSGEETDEAAGET
jgi:hypothetical protein